MADTVQISNIHLYSVTHWDPPTWGPQASGLEAVKMRCRCERGVWICIRMRSGTAVEHVLDAAIESAPRHLIVGRYTDKDRIMHELRRTRERAVFGLLAPPYNIRTTYDISVGEYCMIESGRLPFSLPAMSRTSRHCPSKVAGNVTLRVSFATI